MRKKETCHFWLGRISDKERAAAYFEENYDREDDEPLSGFARDQSETWYDHDFMESGFDADANSIADLVEGYSYYEQYTDFLSKRAAEMGLTNINMFLFINKEQIRQPRSVEGNGCSLHYVGEFTYSI